MTRVWVGAGSNVRPVAHLTLAVEALGARYGRLDLSAVYRNPPVGFAGDDFLNMVVGFATEVSLGEVAACLAEIHARVGRVAGDQKFGPRKLDLDLVLFGELVDPLRRIPRPDVLRYGFVLGPLAALAPDLRHPVTGVTMAAAWRAYTGPRQLRNLGPLAGLTGMEVTGPTAGGQ